ncbi:MAG: 2,3-bisphosphoglycerate-independent phosphoglycerate mutase [Atopococcus tabaci]|uniref:2,3-bisphosphoglycerate-independent phosphoglycerate mutase n=1 Tax=Atopococcus tabaci TaxID=269774 RepID=A0AA43ZS33_9LACT|nr:2,3-bisphosphoglycerate-independent phosphoglycerate mutase [Atopococcus tabaci]
MTKDPVAVIILDGLGYRKEHQNNAVCQAETPFLDYLWEKYPHTTMKASGEAVGLPEGQIGNSEVGHTNIGAGRVVYQSLTRINKSIEEGEFYDNKALKEAIDYAKDQNSALQIFGLLSDGRVHSDQEHLYAILEVAQKEGLEKVYIHAATDGRDVAPDSALGYIQQLQEKIDQLGIGKIATVIGRYYAMDRDKRWPRVERAYDAMILGEGKKSTDPAEAVADSYKRGIYDEFIEPVVIEENGEPVAQISDNDSVLFFNFRTDRVRQLSTALTHEEFNEFERKKFLQNIKFTTMMDYGDEIVSSIMFEPIEISHTLGQIVSEAGLKQLRIAETEKYPHVTYFMNGGVETKFEGEDRLLIPSPQVDTYDLQPEMSAGEITDSLVECIDQDLHDLIILNFANPDMVGHSGKLDAAVKAVEAVDKNLKKVVEALLEKEGTAIIFADHGNAELMADENGKPHTAHTTSLVPVVVTREGLTLREDTALCDIAPTALELLDVTQAREMTGQTIIKEQ